MLKDPTFEYVEMFFIGRLHGFLGLDTRAMPSAVAITRISRLHADDVDWGAGAKDDTEILADEVVVAGKVDGEADVRGVAKETDFGSLTPDLSKDCELSVRTSKGISGTAGSVRVTKAYLGVSARGHHIVFRFDSGEFEVVTDLTHSTVTRWREKIEGRAHEW